VDLAGRAGSQGRRCGGRGLWRGWRRGCPARRGWGWAGVGWVVERAGRW